MHSSSAEMMLACKHTVNRTETGKGKKNKSETHRKMDLNTIILTFLKMENYYFALACSGPGSSRDRQFPWKSGSSRNGSYL